MGRNVSIFFASIFILLATAMLPMGRCMAEEAKNLAVRTLAERLENASDIDAQGFERVVLGETPIDFVVGSDDVAVLFAVYPEESDYIAVAREKDSASFEHNELSPTLLDELLVQHQLLHSLEREAVIHQAIIASTDTLSSMRDTWGGELEEKEIDLVEYKDYESYLRNLFPIFPSHSDDDVMEDGALGLDASHPIRVVEMDAEYAYFRRLETEEGHHARALRWGSFRVEGFEGPMDRWLVERAPDSFETLYVYAYGPTNTLIAPPGFSLDMDGIEEEFARFHLSEPAPANSDEPWPEEAVEAEEPFDDYGETVLVGSVKIPPPRGFVALDTASDEFRNLQEETDTGTPMRLAAAFVPDPDVSDDEGVALVWSLPETVPLSFFRESISSIVDDLFSRDPRSGVYAPHRMTGRSLQWTETRLAFLPSENGPQEEVRIFESSGLLWISGWSLVLGLPPIQALPDVINMGVVQCSRKELEAWEERILRANGINPQYADTPGRLLGEDLQVKFADSGTSLPLAMPPQPQPTEWWQGWNGFAIKMAVKIGLPLFAFALTFLIGKAKGKKKST